MMKLWCSPYQLKLKHADATRRGALIKIELPDAGVGYADLHPSIELGDLSVEQQLSLFRQRQQTPQLQQSIYFAQLDAGARNSKKSLFEGLKIPKSHFLVLAVDQFTRDDFEKATTNGFESFKFKLGRDLKLELDALVKISEFTRTTTKLRFDFNNKLTQGVFHEFWRALPVALQQKVEFVEDPFIYNEFDWLRADQVVPLALDKDLGVHLNSERGYSVAVIKPAKENVEVVLPKIKNLEVKYLFTSYLDHPVGQFFAALSASQCPADFRRLDNGLITQNVFEKNEYIERIKSQGPWLEPQGDIGIGFGDLLEKESWMPIYEN